MVSETPTSKSETAATYPLPIYPHVKTIAEALATLATIADACEEGGWIAEALICKGLLFNLGSAVEYSTLPESPECAAARDAMKFTCPSIVLGPADPLRRSYNPVRLWWPLTSTWRRCARAIFRPLRPPECDQ